MRPTGLDAQTTEFSEKIVYVLTVSAPIFPLGWRPPDPIHPRVWCCLLGKASGSWHSFPNGALEQAKHP